MGRQPRWSGRRQRCPAVAFAAPQPHPAEGNQDTGRIASAAGAMRQRAQRVSRPPRAHTPLASHICLRWLRTADTNVMRACYERNDAHDAPHGSQPLTRQVSTTPQMPRRGCSRSSPAAMRIRCARYCRWAGRVAGFTPSSAALVRAAPESRSRCPATGKRARLVRGVRSNRAGGPSMWGRMWGRERETPGNPQKT